MRTLFRELWSVMWVSPSRLRGLTRPAREEALSAMFMMWSGIGSLGLLSATILAIAWAMWRRAC